MGELAEFLEHNDADFRKARLPALYADFRSQSKLNPDGYRANITAWQHALALLAAHGRLSNKGSAPNCLIARIDDTLLRNLESRQYGQPLSLGAVIQESVSTKDILPLQTFLQAPTSVYQKTWGQVPWAVMGWGLRQIGIIDPTRGDDKLPKGEFVLMENVEKAAKAFDSKITDASSRFERVFSKTQFYQTFSSGLFEDQKLSEGDMEVFLRFLSREKTTIEYDGKLVRVMGAGEPRGITEEDATIASLKELIEKLQHQTKILNDKIEQLDVEARKAVARKNKVSALAALKSKKIAESSLSQRYASLTQVEEVALKIEQAADNVQLVKVMESSSGVLKNLNAQVGGVDKVDAVMDEVRDKISDTEELTNILAESTGAAVDEDELDDELAAMEKEAKEQQDAKEAKETLGKLPEVPSQEV
ncbi:hypothetical protein Golomagni_05466, partial [Golovinomyces magnicellulatus]